MTNMTKKEIQEASTMQLAIRMNALISSTENDVEGVSLVDAIELVEIDEELKKRLYKALGRKLERPTVKFSSSTPIKQKAKKARSIKFNVVAYSLLGGEIARFQIEADTKIEANILTRKELVKRRLDNAHYKIS